MALLPPPLFPLPLEPQPMPTPTIAPRMSMPRMARQLRRRAGIPKKKSMASVAPPPIAKNLFNGRLRAALLELVAMVSVEVTAVVPLMLTEVGERLQVTPPAVGATEQARATLPVNPLPGVTAMVVVAELPAVMEPLFGLAVTAKVGVAAEVTITVRVVVGISVPEVPVIVTV